jgi:dTDP-4-amino-4,6-dideoxygalactose transaminase
MLRDHGQSRKYFHEIEGYNGRLDAIQAALLHVKLSHLANWNTQRRERAAEYKHLLSNDKTLIIPHEPAWSRAVYHLYVVRTQHREAMMHYLRHAGIDTSIHYPVPLHMQTAYKLLSYSPEDFPVAFRVSREILSLPMFPQLTQSQQSRVAAAIAAFTSSIVPLQLPIQNNNVAPAMQVS